MAGNDGVEACVGCDQRCVVVRKRDFDKPGPLELFQCLGPEGIDDEGPGTVRVVSMVGSIPSRVNIGLLYRYADDDEKPCPVQPSIEELIRRALEKRGIQPVANGVC